MAEIGIRQRRELKQLRTALKRGKTIATTGVVLAVAGLGTTLRRDYPWALFFFLAGCGAVIAIIGGIVFVRAKRKLTALEAELAAAKGD